VRTFAHGELGRRPLHHLFLALDLFSIDDCSYLGRQVLDGERRSAGGIVRLAIFNWADGEGQMLSRDGIVGYG
jgi:hypothetical protein